MNILVLHYTNVIGMGLNVSSKGHQLIVRRKLMIQLIYASMLILVSGMEEVLGAGKKDLYS